MAQRPQKQYFLYIFKVKRENTALSKQITTTNHLSGFSSMLVKLSPLAKLPKLLPLRSSLLSSLESSLPFLCLNHKCWTFLLSSMYLRQYWHFQYVGSSGGGSSGGCVTDTSGGACIGSSDVTCILRLRELHALPGVRCISDGCWPVTSWDGLDAGDTGLMGCAKRLICKKVFFNFMIKYSILSL